MLNLELFWLTTSVGQFSAMTDVNWRVDSEDVCPVCKLKKYKTTPIPELRVRYAQKKWPDIIYCINSQVVSERVINDLVDNNITGFEAVKMDFVEVTPKNKPAPMPYYCLQLTGHATFRPLLPPDIVCHTCPICGSWDSGETLSNGMKVFYYLYEILSWDGQDIVRARREQSSLVCCSRRVIELARKKEWTNFEFLRPDILNVRVRHTEANWEELLLMDLKKECLKYCPQNNIPIPEFLLQVPDVLEG